MPNIGAVRAHDASHETHPRQAPSIYIALCSRLARASMLDVFGADDIRIAHQGLSGRQVTYRHGLRNGQIPVVTKLGLQMVSFWPVPCWLRRCSTGTALAGRPLEPFCAATTRSC
ncbi:hypothetical protein [Pseudooceanicola atlanticus]|nr:hypothetical protein [Pseudooceanicola atlanticus]